jgi:aryl-alcohol dehydrogenase-like predicted oxidoreductase
VDAIAAGIAAGVTAIDTAPMYGCGHSEQVVGRALAAHPGAQVLTKVGLRWDRPEGAFFFSTQHPRTGAPLPVEESMAALADLVDAGTVKAVGVSNFDVPLLTRAQAALAQRGIPLASNQPRYSLLDRSIEEAILPWCHAHGVGTLAYSPLGQGLLTGKVTPERVFGPGDGRADHPLFSVASRRAIAAANAQVAPMAEAHGCSLAQLALAWCLHQPGVTAVLAGARDATQIVENASAASISLSEEECAILAAAFEGLGSSD